MPTPAKDEDPAWEAVEGTEVVKTELAKGKSEVTQDSKGSNTGLTIYIAIGAGCGAVLLFIIILVCCIKRRRSHSKTRDAPADSTVGMFDNRELYEMHKRNQMATMGSKASTMSVTPLLSDPAASSNTYWTADRDNAGSDHPADKSATMRSWVRESSDPLPKVPNATPQPVIPIAEPPLEWNPAQARPAMSAMSHSPTPSRAFDPRLNASVHGTPSGFPTSSQRGGNLVVPDAQSMHKSNSLPQNSSLVPEVTVLPGTTAMSKIPSIPFSEIIFANKLLGANVLQVYQGTWMRENQPKMIVVVKSYSVPNVPPVSLYLDASFMSLPLMRCC